ncbi:Protein FAR1-RELATED SEQUENCE 5 [Hordeum vulgare]|nr:Protein FAR1-RELATED SEQUENCE 5 [Hordeum vulgare]
MSLAACLWVKASPTPARRAVNIQRKATDPSPADVNMDHILPEPAVYIVSREVEEKDEDEDEMDKSSSDFEFFRGDYRGQKLSYKAWSRGADEAGTGTSHKQREEEHTAEHYCGGDFGFSDEEEVSRLPSGRKIRLKKKKERRWYDPSLPDAHEQFAMHLCFQNVVEFREALQNFHVSTLRNIEYHRNEPTRVIAWCSHRKQGCVFYMVASRIAHEATFNIKKINLDQTCGASGECTKATVNWVAKVCEDTIRSNPAAGVETIMTYTKKKFGIHVPKSLAYRARKQAVEVVQGDHKLRYHRLRDYLQCVLDTNRGTRCIVTTPEDLENPAPTLSENYSEVGSSMPANAQRPPRVRAATAPEPRPATARDTTYAPSPGPVATSRSNKRFASTTPAATPRGTTKRSRTNTSPVVATTPAKKKSNNTPVRNTRSSTTSPTKNTRFASAQRDGSMRRTRTFIAPRQLTSIVVQAGSKRIMKPSGRLKDYFYASGN